MYVLVLLLGVVAVFAGPRTASGTTSGRDDGVGTAVITFRNPNSLTVDSNGVVYVADSANHLIRKLIFAGNST